MKLLTDEEVVDRAQRWARFHKNEKYRDKMDEVLVGLSETEKRRVYLCGQRIAGGLPIKVIPAASAATPSRKEQTNGKEDKAAKERRPAAVAKSTGTPEKGKAVGADSGAKKSSHRRSRASGAK
jgi:hypothetical protein